MLQARQVASPFAFMESCKLSKGIGEGLRALQELDNALQQWKRDHLPVDPQASTTAPISAAGSRVIGKVKQSRQGKKLY